MVATIPTLEKYIGGKLVSRKMTLEKVRAAWLRLTIGITIPGHVDQGLVAVPGMGLAAFILFNGIELEEAKLCAFML